MANQLCSRCRQRKLEFVKHLVEARLYSNTKPEQKFYHVPVSLCLLGCDVPEKYVAHSVEIGIHNAAAELNEDLERGKRRIGPLGQLVNRVGQTRLCVGVGSPLDDLCQQVDVHSLAVSEVHQKETWVVVLGVHGDARVDE